MNMPQLIRGLPGPILVIGASGFIGNNLLRTLLGVRSDVLGTSFSGKSWRLNDISSLHTAYLNLHDSMGVRLLFQRIKPKVVFNCSSFGAYSFETDLDRIHSTNYAHLIRLLEVACGTDIKAFVNAGSSSEYGLNAAGPAEDAPLMPNSHYAVSKASASHAISFYGKVHGLLACNLRIYSAYGPYEDSSRLIPVLCEHSLRGVLPPFALADVARDFISVGDVVEAFVRAALAMKPVLAGESFNIGTGTQTSLGQLAKMAGSLFDIADQPSFGVNNGRAWDVTSWYADPRKAEEMLGWKSKIPLDQGLLTTRDWWRTYLNQASFSTLTKKGQSRTSKNSISAIVACYKDAQAIPIMYQRLADVFKKINIDYEIIFVNDDSPDDSAERIKAISTIDSNVMGITHSRNFGSQAAFRSGMELSSKESCVLLDGDLQDPPELIESFVEHWRKGADVVYGRRVKREMPAWLDMCYKAFYRLFATLSEVQIPKDAGDFSLIDRSVVHWMLECKERDAFLRGLRAYVGFKQVGISYVRPERMFGHSTNNILRNIGWAKKAIFSFSRIPLHMLTAVGAIAFVGSCLLALYTVISRLAFPQSAPQGITFISLLVLLFGSATLLSLGLLGEYVGKIVEETKARPHFIRKHIIRYGEIHTDPLPFGDGPGSGP